jgi:hypothetical protein
MRGIWYRGASAKLKKNQLTTQARWHAAVSACTYASGEVLWPLAPVPPCEQVLAVVGDGCWGIISSSLIANAHTNHPMSRGLIGVVLCCLAVVSLASHSPRLSLPCGGSSQLPFQNKGSMGVALLGLGPPILGASE